MSVDADFGSVSLLLRGVSLLLRDMPSSGVHGWCTLDRRRGAHYFRKLLQICLACKTPNASNVRRRTVIVIVIITYILTRRAVIAIWILQNPLNMLSELREDSLRLV